MTKYEVRNNSLETLMHSSLITEEIVGSATYDALGRRIQTLHSSLETRYYYDGQNVVAEYEEDEGETLLRYFIHGHQYIDERAVLHDAVNDHDYYYFNRELYSVEGLVNNRGHEDEALLLGAEWERAATG